MSAPSLTNFLLALIALILLGATLQATQSVVIPIILALSLAVIVQPLLKRLSRRMHDGLALTLVLLLLAGFIFAAGTLFAASLSGISAKVPEYSARFQSMFEGVVSFAADYGVEISADQIDTSSAVNWALASLSTAFGSILNLVGQIFLILLMMVFLLLEGAVFRQKINVAFEDQTAFRLSRSLNIIASKIQKYVLTKTLISLLTGFCTALVTWILGVDFPIFWGGLAFMLNYIPNVGSIIAVIPPVLVALLQFPSPVNALVTAALLTSVQMVIGNVLEPRILGRSLQLSTFVVVIAMLAWGWLWGIVGVVISVPLTVAIKIICENIEPLRPIAFLLSDIAEINPLRKEPASPLEPLPNPEPTSTPGIIADPNPHTSKPSPRVKEVAHKALEELEEELEDFRESDDAEEPEDAEDDSDGSEDSEERA